MKTNIIKYSTATLYVLLYIIVATISCICSIDFFDMTHNYMESIILAISFEIGSMGCLFGAITTMKNKNSFLIWILFLFLTAMQMMSNTYYAYAHIENYNSWIELFDLIDLEPITQKRIISIISGCVLPLVSLSFVHLLVDLFRVEDNISVEQIEEQVKQVEPTEQIEEVEEQVEEVEEQIEPTEQVEEVEEQVEPTEQVEEVEEQVEPTEQVEEVEEQIEPTEQVEEVEEQVEPTETVEEVEEQVEEVEEQVEPTEPTEPIEEVEEVEEVEHVPTVHEGIVIETIKNKKSSFEIAKEEMKKALHKLEDYNEEIKSVK